MAIDGAAWLGFGGVLAGAVLGFASSAAQARASRRHELRRLRDEQAREDEIRFEGRRFDAYVAMITSANRFYSVAKYPSTRVPLEDGGSLSPISQAYEQFMISLSPAFLMATSATTRDCLADLAGAVRAILERVAGPAADATEDLEPLFRAHRHAVRAAEAAMREEFGLVRLPPAAL